MYLPKYAEEKDKAVLYDLMRRFNFALLITTDDAGIPFATPIPFLVHESQNILESHVAKANPQWQHLQTGREALVVFQGEHAYISPSWYQTFPRVPTWNYVTVHVYVKPEIISEPEKVLVQLQGLVQNHEQHQEKPWSMDSLPEKYVEGMTNALVAFRLKVLRLEGKFKLGHNGPDQDRELAGKFLESSNKVQAQAIGRMMQESKKEES